MKIKYTLHIAIAALVVTGAVAAQEIVTPEQFDEISTNKTLYFNSGERFHGAEQYPEPQCWNFIQDGDRFLARLLGGDPANDLELTFVDTKELLCEAPYLGASFAR